MQSTIPLSTWSMWSTTRLVYVTILTVITSLQAHIACAQSFDPNYPSNSVLTEGSFPAANRSLIEALIQEPNLRPEALRSLRTLCTPPSMLETNNSELRKSSVVETKASIAAELYFERTSGSSTAFIDSYSIYAEFSPTRLLLQHSRPRFASEHAGYSIPFPTEATRAVRIEGELGADILALIPPMRECSVQAVAICPRRFEKVDRLLDSPYAPRATRFFASAKADAVAASPTNSTIKVMSSILATPGINLPEAWFDVTVGKATLTAQKSIAPSHVKAGALPPLRTIDALPVVAGIASRIDIGNESTPAYTTLRRQDIEVSRIEVREMPKLSVGRSTLSVTGGPCWLLSVWSHEML